MAQENFVFHIAQTVKLHMYKDETPVRIPLQQYDSSAQKINFDILMGSDFDDDTAEEVTLPTVGGGAAVQRDKFFAKIEGTKADGTGFSYDCDPCSFYKDSNGRYKITTAATVTEQMTAAEGAVRVWIKIENKGSKVDDTPTAVKHSEVFVFAVERAAFDEGKVDLSKTEIPSVEAKLQGYVEDARGYAGDAGYQAALAKQYAEGMPGVSPEVEVEAISGGHTVTITDLNGEKTFAVMDGTKGDKGDTGEDGADGISPNVAYSTKNLNIGADAQKTPRKYTHVTITDAEGAKEKILPPGDALQFASAPTSEEFAELAGDREHGGRFLLKGFYDPDQNKYSFPYAGFIGDAFMFNRQQDVYVLPVVKVSKDGNNVKIKAISDDGTTEETIAPGLSPTITTTPTENGYAVNITDIDGQKTITLLNGEKGDKGDTGAQGEKGEKGDKGDTGAQGAQGEKGEKGDTGAQGEKGEKGDKGDPGLSPTITTTPTENGHTLTITDIDGKKTLTLLNGEKGAQGEKGDTGATGQQGEKGDKGDTGEAGVSPTVTTEAITNGHKVTITDATGAHEFTLTNGAQGEPGYTPVKGTDYFTEQDVSDFVDMLAERFDGTNMAF